MDKIKSLLSPGASKDEELMYGDHETRLREAKEHPATGRDPIVLPDQPQKTGGVLGQITNPDGAKYNEQAYYPSDATGTAGNEGGVLQQITNPDHKKYDEARFDESAGTAPTLPGAVAPNAKLETEPETKEGGVLRQILNPGGSKRDEVAYGSNAAVVGGQSSTAGNASGATTVGTAATSSATTTTPAAPSTYTTTQTTQTLPDRSLPATTSNTGRDAAILGSGAAVGTGAGIAAAKYNEPQDHVLDRSHPLRDGSGRAADHINPVGAPETVAPTNAPANIVTTYGTTTSDGGVRSADAHVNPIGAPRTAGTAGVASSHTGRDAAIIGGAAGAGLAGGAAATRDGGIDNSLPNSTFNPLAGTDVGSTSAMGSNTAGPTAAGSTTAPAPTGLNSYTDSSHSGRDTGLVSAAGLAGAGVAAGHTHTHQAGSGLGHSSSINHPPGQNLDCDGSPVEGYVHHVSGPHSLDIANQLDPKVAAGPPLSSADVAGNDNHLGRDAAVVGGAGAVGAGAYTATRDTNPPIANTTTNAANTSSHHGRDAAVVGGAGAVGAGAYAATRDSAIPTTTATTTTTSSTTAHGTDPALDRAHHTTEGKHNHKHHQPREEEFEHGEKKPGLIQKILHPRSHGKEDKEDEYTYSRDVQDSGRLSSEGHEHNRPKTIVDESGHNKLHKDPPPSHPAAQVAAGVAGPDWDAVNKAN